MQRFVIAVDCDDVLINSTEWLIAQYNQRYGTEVSLANAFILDEAEFGTGYDQIFKRFHDLYQTEDFRLVKPRQDAIEVVQKLSKQHELHLVTSRNLILELVTLQMLNAYFPGCFTEINHVGEGSKGQICKAIKADIIIDDNAGHLNDAQNCGVEQRIWFGAYPWQSHDAKSSSFTSKAKDWYAVEKAVNQVSD